MVVFAAEAGSADDDPPVCAICKKQGPDYVHSCGAEFHKSCLEEYKKFIGSSDVICPHCLEKVSYDEKKKEAVDFIGTTKGPEDLLAQQYLDLSTEYYLEHINNDMYYVRAFVTNMDPESGIWHMYPITINYSNYPERPRMTIPEDVLTDALDLTETIDMLRGWKPDSPPQLVELVKSIEHSITDKNRLYEEIDQLVNELEGVSDNASKVGFSFDTYGGRKVEFSLGLANYPHAPDVMVEGVPLGKGFETLKAWTVRESTLNEVAVEIKARLMHHYRRAFEIELLERYFDVDDNERLIVGMRDPGSGAFLIFKVDFPPDHPAKAPRIDVDQYENVSTEDLENIFGSLEKALKDWKSDVYVVDVLRALQNELFEHGGEKCPTCGDPDCPDCGADLEEGCREVCPNCGHAFHAHCQEGMEICPYCLIPFPEEVYEVEVTD